MQELSVLLNPSLIAFIHFTNDGERNKFIRSANMLKRELRGRKIRITRSMEAEERFHNKRMDMSNAAFIRDTTFLST